MVNGAQAVSNALPLRQALAGDFHNDSNVRSGWSGVRVATLAGLVLLVAAVLVALANLRLSYSAAAEDVISDAGRSSQRLASRLGRSLDQVGQVTQVIKQLHDGGAGRSLDWMKSKGLLPEQGRAHA